MVDPAFVILLTDTRVTPIAGEYRASNRCTFEFPLFPFGMWINNFPFSIAWKVHLSAAVIGIGFISTRLINLW